MHPKRFLSLWYVWRKLCTYLAPILTPCPNGSKRDSTRPTHLGVASGACKTISKPMVRLAQTVHLSASAISPNGPKQASTWITRFGDGDNVHGPTTTIQGCCTLATDTPPPTAVAILWSTINQTTRVIPASNRGTSKNK